ncbi:hypothetical protein GCM10022215_29550 [Nocardioides fonticola]|uniref:Uncharacterized protein n=2 Tax=Nocardioides fonticola TaxID=450363 RepID=A0ABP7XP70_9ACTN
MNDKGLREARAALSPPRATVRPMADSVEMLTARLLGTARRHAIDKTPDDVAIAELHAISRVPSVLGRAAGVALGGWQHDPITHPWSPRIGALLEAAGADLATRDTEAAVVLARLSAQEGRARHP